MEGGGTSSEFTAPQPNMTYEQPVQDQEIPTQNYKPNDFVNPYAEFEQNAPTNQDIIAPQIPGQNNELNDSQNNSLFSSSPENSLKLLGQGPTVQNKEDNTDNKEDDNENKEEKNESKEEQKNEDFNDYYHENTCSKICTFIKKHKHSLISSIISLAVFIVEISLMGAQKSFTVVENQAEFVPEAFGYIFYIMHGLACVVLPFTLPFSLKTEIGKKVSAEEGGDNATNNEETDNQNVINAYENNEVIKNDSSDDEKKRMKEEHEKKKQELLEARLAALTEKSIVEINESSLVYNSAIDTFTKGQNFRFFTRIYIPAIMILLNLIAGVLNDLGLVIAAVLEIALVFYLFIEPPYYTTYRYNMAMLGVSKFVRTLGIKIVKKQKEDEEEDSKQDEEENNYREKIIFWCGEVTMLLLCFAFLSVCIAVGGLSYLMLHRYFTGPVRYRLKDLIEITNLASDIETARPYLPVYSIYLMLVVGMGFGMSCRNSYGMILPFLLIAIGTVIRLPKAGVIIIVQLCIHIAYMLFFCRECTRNTLAGAKFDCCLECCRTTLTTVILGDVIALLLFAFPLLYICGSGLSIEEQSNIVFFSFAGSSILSLIAIVLHLCIVFENDNKIIVFFAGGCFAASGIALGASCCGNWNFYGTAVYECTYLAWSITLCLWCYPNGYSPFLFKLYNALISIGVLLSIIYIDENVYWIEILCCVVQIIFDTFILQYIARCDTRYVAWVLFSFSGIAILAFIVAVIVIIIITICVLVMRCLGKSMEDCSDYSRALDYAREHGYKSGDTFKCGGKIWKVT